MKRGVRVQFLNDMSTSQVKSNNLLWVSLRTRWNAPPSVNFCWNFFFVLAVGIYFSTKMCISMIMNASWEGLRFEPVFDISVLLFFFQTRVHSVLKQQKSKPSPQPPELENAERCVWLSMLSFRSLCGCLNDFFHLITERAWNKTLNSWRSSCRRRSKMVNNSLIL